MQKVLYRQDKLRHWLEGMTNYQEETVFRFDEELNNIQSELRKLKRRVSKLGSQKVKKTIGECDKNEVQTTDLAFGTLGCCKPGLSRARGKCCQPNFLVTDYINLDPIGTGVTESTNCCGVAFNFVEGFIAFSVDGQCCESTNMRVSVAREGPDGEIMAYKCCAQGDALTLNSDFECQSEVFQNCFQGLNGETTCEECRETNGERICTPQTQ